MANDKVYSINKDKVAFRIIDGEAVILNLDNGYYYSLNEVGTKVWGAIDQKKDVESIIGLIKDEYGMSEAQVRKDILDLLDHLKKEELLERSYSSKAAR